MATGDTSKKREFDLVLFGATGFTGRLVAEYLLKKKSKITWALAGRSREKLEAVRRELASLPGASEAKDLPIVIGDSLNDKSVAELVARTRVVCTTVGPYARMGEPLVRACAADGVHYCDLTGETHFIRRIIDSCHDRAVTTGARIVPSSGFDSIPSDLGVLMLHERALRDGKQLAKVSFRVRRMNGAASGGTIASVLEMLEEARDPKVRRVLGDPYALYPAGVTRGRDRSDQKTARRDESGRWTAPFMMAAINTRVVRRSNALLDFAYGKDFRYDEAVDTGAGVAGFGRAAAMTAGMGFGIAALAFPPTRKLAQLFLPAPGEGPTREQRERGSFRIELHGVMSDGQKIEGVVAQSLDPGYGGTAVMLGETALCLAEDDLPARGGVLTTASCMGTTLIDRLRSAGMTFQVV